MQFEKKGEDMILHDGQLDLKISNRQIFFKVQPQTNFKLATKQQVPLGFSAEQKQKLLTILDEKIKDKLRQVAGTQSG